MTTIGSRTRRREDLRLLTGAGRFVANLNLPGAAHVVFVRSLVAHGRIRSIELEAARSLPGVLTVADASSLGAFPMSGFPPFPRPEFLMSRPLGDGEKVRWAGEAYAAVVAETREQAVDAAELVWADIQALEPVLDPWTAGDVESQVFDQLPGNVMPAFSAGAVESLDTSGCDIVVRTQIINSRMSGVPLECRVGAARWEPDGTVTCWSATQGPHVAQAQIASAAGIEPDQVRVIIADVGGAFGSKATPGPEECALPLLARLVDRPVVWAETRTENLLAMPHSRAMYQTVTLGGRADGRFTHYHLNNRVDSGASAGAAGYLAMLSSAVTPGCYSIDNVRYTSETTLTNTTPIGAFRGAGRPEAISAIERSVDLFAAEAGLDPAEVRRRNLIAADAFPFENGVGSTYDSGNYQAALDLALERSDYHALREDQAKRRASGTPLQLGIGLACFVETTAGAPGPQSDFATVTLTSDGRMVVRTGASAMGQGHETAMAMIAADRLGVPLDSIDVIYGDTTEIEHSVVTSASRTVQVTGSVVLDGSDQLIAAAKIRAAELLEAAIDDVDFATNRGAFHVRGVPSVAVSWAEVAGASEGPIVGRGDFAQNAPTFASGVNVAVVEVDTETGNPRVLRMIAVDDAGTIINPMLAEGQIHGGLASGIAQALYESIAHDEQGTLVTSNLADYLMISPTELPSFELDEIHSPSPNNPLGAKGVGESGVIGSAVAVQNAVIDAVRHLGVSHIDMPCSPERIWRSIQQGERQT